MLPPIYEVPPGFHVPNTDPLNSSQLPPPLNQRLRRQRDTPPESEGTYDDDDEQPGLIFDVNERMELQ